MYFMKFSFHSNSFNTISFDLIVHNLCRKWKVSDRCRWNCQLSSSNYSNNYCFRWWLWLKIVQLLNVIVNDENSLKTKPDQARGQSWSIPENNSCNTNVFAKTKWQKYCKQKYLTLVRHLQCKPPEGSPKSSSRNWMNDQRLF